MTTIILKLCLFLCCASAFVSAASPDNNKSDNATANTSGNLRRRTQDSNDCFTGSSIEATQWCSSNNKDCCQGLNACHWTGSKQEVCSGSCNGQAACFRGQFGKVEADSCNGLGACQEIEASVVHTNSCNGQAACFKLQGNRIAENSCNNFQACHNAKAEHVNLLEGCNEFAECDDKDFKTSFTGTGAEVTALCNGRCCVGEGACQWTWTKTVGVGSCMGTFACKDNGAASIGLNSCVGTAACRGNRVDMIGNHSCNDYAACYNIKAQEIDDNTCTGWQSCRLTDARNLPVLTGCNGSSACEEQTL